MTYDDIFREFGQVVADTVGRFLFCVFFGFFKESSKRFPALLTALARSLAMDCLLSCMSEYGENMQSNKPAK